MSDWKVELDPKAHALRPVRTLVKEDEFRFYEAVTFPDNPWQGCELYLRRCKAFGYLVDKSLLMIDVIDEQGDILQEFPISREGFEYLRRILRFRVERE